MKRNNAYLWDHNLANIDFNALINNIMGNGAIHYRRAAKKASLVISTCLFFALSTAQASNGPLSDSALNNQSL
jgi:hypothetical protein